MSGEEEVVPLAEEVARITRRQVPAGRVRVRVVPAAREETVEVTLRDRTAEVERVPVGRFVEAAPPVRTEGDTTVIPLVEERAVVTVRLFLREELRVRTKTTPRAERRRVTLRTETAEVERLDPNQGELPHE